MKTVTEFLRETITKVILEIPELIKKPNFYKNIALEIDKDDRNAKVGIESFIEITTLVG